MEIWKDIEGYEGLYQISNEGNVKNFRRDTILKPSGKRYKGVTLSRDNIKYYPNIHRLVAEAFIPNPNNYPIVMHKDNNGCNNKMENLKWGTHSENNKQAYDDGNQEYCKMHNSIRLKRSHKQKNKMLRNYV